MNNGCKSGYRLTQLFRHKGRAFDIGTFMGHFAVKLELAGKLVPVNVITFPERVAAVTYGDEAFN